MLCSEAPCNKNTHLDRRRQRTKNKNHSKTRSMLRNDYRSRLGRGHVCARSGHVLGTFWAPSGHLLGTFWARSEHVLGTFWPRSGHLLSTFWASSGHALTAYEHALGSLWHRSAMGNCELRGRVAIATPHSRALVTPAMSDLLDTRWASPCYGELRAARARRNRNSP